jgi:hypothetical protein
MTDMLDRSGHDSPPMLRLPFVCIVVSNVTVAVRNAKGNVKDVTGCRGERHGSGSMRLVGDLMHSLTVAASIRIVPGLLRQTREKGTVDTLQD